MPRGPSASPISRKTKVGAATACTPNTGRRRGSPNQPRPSELGGGSSASRLSSGQSFPGCIGPSCDTYRDHLLLTLAGDHDNQRRLVGCLVQQAAQLCRSWIRELAGTGDDIADAQTGNGQAS